MMSDQDWEGVCIKIYLENIFYFVPDLRISTAGFPATVEKGRTFLVTTEPAPIIAPSPMVIPQRIVTLDPMDAPIFINVFSIFQSLSVCIVPSLLVARGYKSLIKVTL